VLTYVEDAEPLELVAQTDLVLGRDADSYSYSVLVSSGAIRSNKNKAIATFRKQLAHRRALRKKIEKAT